MLKLKILTFIIFASFSLSLIGQNELQQSYLTSYGQVWGFLKYFHPKPSELNWDNVLLNDYAEIIKCQTNEEFSILIDDLIANCGDYNGEQRDIVDSLNFKQSYMWLEESLLTDKQRTYLIELLNNKPIFKNKYISGTPVGIPKFTNEEDYGVYNFEPSIQFLSITRYWNIINYFCPNRDIIPKNWTQVYRVHVNDFIQANSYEKYYFAIRKLSSEIRDGHGFVRAENNPMNAYKYAPFFCLYFSDGYYINTVFQDSLHSINLKRKDKLISIDGIPVEEKINQLGMILSTSNDYYLSNYTHYLRITDQDSITIAISREGKLIKNTYAAMDEKTMISRYKRTPSVEKKSPYSLLIDSLSGKQYCYVNLGRLKRKDINSKFKRKLSQTDNLIIDVRNYPNWTLIKFSDLLIKDKGKFAKFKAMNFDYPGSYKWTQSQTIGNKKNGYNGNIYVLVDYHTMSQAEYTVMAFQQHPNTIVIGGQTAGADGNICAIPLPFGIKSVYSGLGVFYPDGTPTQQIGIERDFEVVQESSYLDGKDLIFEKAIELIREK